MTVPFLWVVRKALYTVIAAGLGAGLAYVTGHPDLSTWTLNAAGAAVLAAVVGDLRRAFFPTFLQ